VKVTLDKAVGIMFARHFRGLKAVHIVAFEGTQLLAVDDLFNSKISTYMGRNTTGKAHSVVKKQKKKS
jgi:hypothetical protein